jgi:A/G-specific adenine glycosylase
MELGATVCTPRAPRCDACPWAHLCAARAQGRVEELPLRSRPTPVRRIEAVAGFLERHDRVLAVQRPQRGLLGGLWELPGGDLHDGESPARALARAVRDGLDLAVSAVEPVGAIEHAFTHRLLRVHVYRGAVRAGRVRRAGWDAHRWVSRSALAALPLGGPARKALALLNTLSVSSRSPSRGSAVKSAN